MRWVGKIIEEEAGGRVGSGRTGVVASVGSGRTGHGW